MLRSAEALKRSGGGLLLCILYAIHATDEQVRQVYMVLGCKVGELPPRDPPPRECQLEEVEEPMLRDPQLLESIGRVGAALKSYDPNDPRLPWLRAYWVACSEGGMPPKHATPELIADWLRILRLVPDCLEVRDSRAVCPRCEVGAGIHTGPTVEGYGYRAACNNCGDAWLVRLPAGEKAGGASTPRPASVAGPARP